MRQSLYPLEYSEFSHAGGVTTPWKALLPVLVLLVMSGQDAAGQTHTDEPETVVVTARLRQEEVQSIPISMSVLSGDSLQATVTNNVSQISQLVPSLNYTSPNPRNTAFTIRGLGSSVVAIAQANDGLEPGVGYYVDQVYHARPATAAFDFIDLERVEILRGPQGTLFGKNSTAGVINITTRMPTFTRGAQAEITVGNHGYFQTRDSVSGAIFRDVLAGRISLVRTYRDGVLDNISTGGKHNDIDNTGVRARLLYKPAQDFSLQVSADYSAIDTNCCTQVYFGVGQTLKPPSRQYPEMAATQFYEPASLNPYDRLTDINSALRVMSHEGGLAAIAEWSPGAMTLTSVSAWRFWKWDAANDRDYTSLPIQTVQGIPSRQDQYSQEFRIASSGRNVVDYTMGLYGFTQNINAHPVTEYGPAGAFWLLGPEPATPANLLDGYRTEGDTRFRADSYAAFGEVNWNVAPKLDLSGGVRYTREQKRGRFESTVNGGLETSDADLVRKKLSILRPQSYLADINDGSLSGRASASYHWNDRFMAYVILARAHKSGGINMSGLPLTADNQPAIATAAIKPERNSMVEFGIKSSFLNDRLLLNADIYNTSVRDFQANVVDTGPGALRGYLANIEKVQVRGLEMDASFRLGDSLSGYFSTAWTNGKYASYRNAPCPLELIGSSTTVCDLSGRPLSAVPRLTFSGGAEYRHQLQVLGIEGEAFIRTDFTVRSRIYGDPTDSRYTVIDGHGIVNGSIGFRQAGPWEVLVWFRNMLDKDYMQNLTVQAGNSGLIVGTPGDPLSVGLVVRANFQTAKK